MSSPLSAFSIHQVIGVYSDLLSFDLSITNNSFYLLISLALTVLVFATAGGNDAVGRSLVPSSLALVAESLYASVLNMARAVASNQAMLPLLLGLFTVILMSNLISNIPYTYSSMSALTTSLGLSLTVFIGVTLLALSLKGVSWFGTFVPAGTPSVLLPLLVVIELVSYLARAISLGVRLFANMVAGHSLLGIISSMSNQILMSAWYGILLVIVPAFLLIALVGLEVTVAMIQAYVFTILTAIYHDEATRPMV